MAASNESQGLKIAVSICVALVFILGISCYFLYSNYSQANEKLIASQSELSKAKQEWSTETNRLSELRTMAGYEKFEDFESLKTEWTKDKQKLDETVNQIKTTVDAAVNQMREKGAADAKIAEVQQLAANTIKGYTDEPNRSMVDSLRRLTQLLQNVTQLSAEISRDNVALRSGLNTSNEIASAKLSEETKALQKTKDDLLAEQQAHEGARSELNTKLGELQGTVSTQATQITDLTNNLNQTQEVANRDRAGFTKTIKNLNTQLALKETVLDKPDGVVSYVDYTRNELRVNLRRDQGARPLLRLSIFDKAAPGIPTDRPKGTIELISVGTSDSVAKIIPGSTKVADPIRVGDLVYSAAWSPDEPQRFALIGKMDLDRDGRDDRADVINLIVAAGGKVDFDLPPPGAGQASGEITPTIAWYVIDDQAPLARVQSRIPNKEFLEYKEKETEALEKAALNGIRPLPLRRLSAYLGYNFNQARPGQSEMTNDKARDAILFPRGRSGQTGTTPPAPGGTQDPQ